MKCFSGFSVLAEFLHIERIPGLILSEFHVKERAEEKKGSFLLKKKEKRKISEFLQNDASDVI